MNTTAQGDQMNLFNNSIRDFFSTKAALPLELAGDAWANERKHYREALAYIELMLRRRETTRDTALAGVAKVALAKWQNDHDWLTTFTDDDNEPQYCGCGAHVIGTPCYMGYNEIGEKEDKDAPGF